MTHRGRVKNGVVVLNDPNALPEGGEVSVRLLKKRVRPVRGKNNPVSLYERLKPVVGSASGLPHDLAENHDHYLHGHPRK
ncbi:MAG: hypothetical protein NT031_02065 [Planctomycetota bacterium]|nr:hypothetical protein [Planctomycetota bacterium]